MYLAISYAEKARDVLNSSFAFARCLLPVQIIDLPSNNENDNYVALLLINADGDFQTVQNYTHAYSSAVFSGRRVGQCGPDV